jgi:hypothetical protein
MKFIETLIPTGQDIQRLWHEKSTDGRVPARSDFSIDDLKPWLGRLILVDILPDGDIFYRVHGTELAEWLGQDLTGKTLSALNPPEFRALIRAEYADIVASRSPAVIRRRRHYEGRGSFVIERILLPLSRDGQTIDQVLTLAGWLPETRQTDLGPAIRGNDLPKPRDGA